MTPAHQPVSLGTNCEAKYQTARSVYFRLFPRATQQAFAEALFRSQPALFLRTAFDWQVTTFSGLVTLLESDFQGGFERVDLEPHQHGWGRVYNRRLRTCHPHDFPPDMPCTDRAIDAHYADFRLRMERAAARFRKHLLTPGPYLYVHRRIDWWEPEPASRDDLNRLLQLLRAGSPAHRCALLYLEEGDRADDWSDPDAGLYRRTVRACDKPEDRRWEGDDESWGATLAEFPLTLHNVIRRSGPAPADSAA